MIVSTDRKSSYKKICDNLKSLRPTSLIYDNINSCYTFYFNSCINENGCYFNDNMSDISSSLRINNNDNKFENRNKSSPESDQSILSTSSDCSSEIFEMVNNYDLKVIQKNIYNNDMKFINTELLCNICVNNLVLDNINLNFTLLYNYQYKEYNKQLKNNNLSKIDTLFDKKLIHNSLLNKLYDIQTNNSKKYLKLLIEIADMNIINLFNLDLTFQDEISILKQIYNAIKAYSNCKIIHNDLFPRNILIKNSNIITPIISDFGYSLIDKESYILTDNKYKKDIDNILYNMNAHENDDITKYINIIYDYNCNFVVDKKSYNNISIYKKDIITITNSVSILSNKKETKNVCESVINKIMNFNIYSFDELKLFLNDILNYI